MAMYITPGRDRPNAPQEAILALYEQCDDLACALVGRVQKVAFKDNFTESEVLTRYHQGLLDDASDFNENEARWVIYRLAELLGWEPPRAVSEVRTY